jgi:hypothetical protein
LLQVADGSYQLESRSFVTLDPDGFEFYSVSVTQRPVVVAGADVVVDVVLPIRDVEFVVVDPDGVPVAGAYVSAQVSEWFFGGPDGDIGHNSVVEASTDVNGRLVVEMLPGTGQAYVTPPAGSGLDAFSVDITIDDSATLAILIQFTPETTSATVNAGEPVSTDSEVTALPLPIRWKPR